MLASLPLLHGWWRAHKHSSDVRQCPDGTRGSSGCVGGAASPCKTGLTGPYCQLCANETGFFYDAAESMCSDCGNLIKKLLGTVVLLGALIAALIITERFGPRVHHFLALQNCHFGFELTNLQ